MGNPQIIQHNVRAHWTGLRCCLATLQRLTMHFAVTTMFFMYYMPWRTVTAAKTQPIQGIKCRVHPGATASCRLPAATHQQHMRRVGHKLVGRPAGHMSSRVLPIVTGTKLKYCALYAWHAYSGCLRCTRWPHVHCLAGSSEVAITSLQASCHTVAAVVKSRTIDKHAQNIAFALRAVLQAGVCFLLLATHLQEYIRSNCSECCQWSHCCHACSICCSQPHPKMDSRYLTKAFSTANQTAVAEHCLTAAACCLLCECCSSQLDLLCTVSACCCVGRIAVPFTPGPTPCKPYSRLRGARASSAGVLCM